MAGLTKQHFNKIAEILRSSIYDEGSEHRIEGVTKELMEGCKEAVTEISNKLADYFITQNPLFKKEQFIKACLE